MAASSKKTNSSQSKSKAPPKRRNKTIRTPSSSEAKKSSGSNSSKKGKNAPTTLSNVPTPSVPAIKKKRTASHKKGFSGNPLSTENLLNIANQVNEKLEEQLGKKKEIIQQRELELQEKEAKMNAKKDAKEKRILEIKAQLIQKEKNKNKNKNKNK